MNYYQNVFGKMDSMLNDMFKFNDFFSNHEIGFNDESLSAVGLKKIIPRSHNLIDVKDKNGNVIANKIEVVTTPFDKKDVKVKIKDNTLFVECGTENKKTEENEVCIHRGISSQTYKFQLSLPKNVNKEKIKAENKDGILTLVLPFKKEEEPDEIEIKID